MSTCRYCRSDVVWLSTSTGRRLPFEVATSTLDAVAAGDSYLVRRDGVAVPTSLIAPRRLVGNPRVASLHRCEEYALWKSGLMEGVEALADILRSDPLDSPAR